MGATFGTKTVITAESGAQNIPIFVMMHNKNASWGLDNGLETIIPAVLTLGISGYHFPGSGTDQAYISSGFEP